MRTASLCGKAQAKSEGVRASAAASGPSPALEDVAGGNSGHRVGRDEVLDVRLGDRGDLVDDALLGRLGS